MRKKNLVLKQKSSLYNHCNVQWDRAVLEKAISWGNVKCSETPKYIIRCPSFAAAGRDISLPQHRRIVLQSITISPYFPLFCHQQSPAIIFSESALRTHVPYGPDFLNKKEDGREKQHCLKHGMLQKNLQEFVTSQWRWNLPFITKEFLHEIHDHSYMGHHSKKLK